MPVAWTPQQMFPLRPLLGGGTVPAQVLLGILAQESNTLQASPHAVDAETGNTNQGGFYGNVSGSIPPGTSWSDVDCGYGVGQVTTAMQLGSTVRPADGSTAFTVAEEQQAIATDYASNIAATLNMVIDKWNQLYSLGIKANGGSPQYIENWWFALWAYNTGVQPSSAKYGNTTGCDPGPACTDNGGSGGNWGLGWSNNPANPAYESSRTMFSANTNYDTSHPQYWSYPERVLGWAATPLARYDFAGGQWAAAYAAGHWPGNPSLAEPTHSAFCFPQVDSCQADSATDVDGKADTAGLCALSNLHCWWNQPATWVTDCSKVCGTQVLTYSATSSVPSGTDIYPPDCGKSTLPAGTVIVADATTPSVGSCAVWWQNQGTFSLSFPDNPAPSCVAPCIDYPGKIDFHQLGDGFGGHVWFTHTQQVASVTATWTPPSTTSGWTRVLVHIPISGATTQQAGYTVGPLADGSYQTRYVNQHFATDDWVDLGVFDLGSGAGVTLTNETYDGAGDEDIAFDAVGFAHLSAKPKDFVVQLGDSYSSGTAAGSYLPGTAVGPYASNSTDTSPGRSWNACLRSAVSWIRDGVLPGDSTGIGALADANDPSLDYHSVACNGAYTQNVDPALGTSSFGDLGQYHEVRQLDSGYLDTNTTLVALTVGGNDAGFSSTVQDCANPLVGCPSDSTVKGKIDAAMTSVSTVLQDIAWAAPHAKIVLLGYPELFNSNPLTCASVIQNTERVELNQWADYMATQEKAAADAANAALQKAGRATPPITFNWSNTEFDGAHICDTGAGINDLVAGPASDDPADFSCPGSLKPCPSMESFHPNAVGTRRYATAFQNALATAKY